jgi:CRP-like cAMP-binding protein
MPTSTGYPLHRPELYDALCEGDALLLRAMAARKAMFGKGQKIVRTGAESDDVYRLHTGWLARTRIVEDGRRQIIMTFLPGDLVGVKSMLLREQPDTLITQLCSRRSSSPSWNSMSFGTRSATAR